MGGETTSRVELKRRIAFFLAQGDMKEAAYYSAQLGRRRSGAKTRTGKYRAKMSDEDKKRERETLRAYRESHKATIVKNREAISKINKLRAMRLLGNVCVDCETAYPPAAMDFHHKDPTVKKFRMAGTRMACKWENIVDEIRKCVLLCANCHRVRHATPGWRTTVHL